MPVRRLRLVVCVVAAALTLAGCDWAQLGFDAGNTGNNAVEPAITPTSVTHFSVAWSQSCACDHPLIAGGSLYATDTSVTGTTSVRAFDAAHGTPRWSHPFAVSPPVTSVRLMAVADGLVYLIVTRSVVALDAATGQTRWSVDPPAPGTGTITIDHLIVDQTGFPLQGGSSTTAFVDVTAAIFNGNPVSEISAIDVSGRIVWSSTPGGRSIGFAGVKANTEPDSAQRTLDVVSVLTTTQPPLFLLSRYHEESGSVSQTVIGPGAPTTDFPPFTDVSAANGLVYMARSSLGTGPTNGVVAIDPTTGNVAWTGLGNGPFAVSSTVLVSSVNARAFIFGMVGLDAPTGAVVWQVASVVSDAAIGGSLVFDTARNGVLEARDLATGAVRGTFAVPNEPLRATPANGIVYATSPQHVYALVPDGT